MTTRASFPLGAGVTLAQLGRDPHRLLARLREHEPVSWLAALDGWLVTRYDLALRVMRDSATFTVDDPRFSTAQVIGPSMLSLDGAQHSRHRDPFAAAFRPGAVRERFADAVAAEAQRLIDSLEPAGGAELRGSFAGPLAASIVTRALGLEQREVDRVRAWYDEIVHAVTEITAGHPLAPEGEQAFGELRVRLEGVTDGGERSSLLTAAALAAAPLTRDQTIANAAVLLFGGIETTEGMIANVVLHLLERPDQLGRVRGDAKRLDIAVEESLRLEPAAAVIDRYATSDEELGGIPIGRGDLVRVSISAANRDPAVFPNPDGLDLSGANGRRHLAFAHGPHVCLGVHLARLEARTALAALLQRLPRLRLDPDRPSSVRGLVFRKPPTLHVLWS
ncbi:MAG: cytochrome P450 [Solirubrobacteraceae bacterium]